jgi:hypothetical protein
MNCIVPSKDTCFHLISLGSFSSLFVLVRFNHRLRFMHSNPDMYQFSLYVLYGLGFQNGQNANWKKKKNKWDKRLINVCRLLECETFYPLCKLWQKKIVVMVLISFNCLLIIETWLFVALDFCKSLQLVFNNHLVSHKLFCWSSFCFDFLCIGLDI